MRHLARDESKRALGQTHQARIGMATGIIDKVIQLHARIGGDAERTPIREANTKLTIWSGLNNIAAINQITQLGLLAIPGQISRNEDRSGMLNPNRPLYDEDLTDRIGVEVRRRLCGALAPSDGWLKGGQAEVKGGQQPNPMRAQNVLHGKATGTVWCNQFTDI